ncbi:MAG: carboxypeptidase regulatory-like domain-containing protein [Rhodospirillaceae bacterium]|nr:carboxypeptidase regulatory-like domain-containing protein [Rhodospirillaceae bacterium]
MRRFGLALLLLVAAMAPAEAHRLKVFATVEAGSVTGYGFFIGGGRPMGATVVISDAAGTELYRARTGADGAFSFTPDAPTDLTVTIDAGDGHVAHETIAGDRFGPPVATGGALAAEPQVPAEAAGPATPVGPDAAAGLSTEALQAMIDRSVDTAVARQIRPLLEAYDEADGRVRFNDVIGGIGMIIGIGGAALWMASRRHRQPPAGRQSGAS